MLEVGVHESLLSVARAEQLVITLRSQRFPCNSILDVGCRAGAALAHFRESLPEAKLGGVDMLDEALVLAAEHADVVYNCDAANMQPIADGEYDWVFCSHTLEHCDNRQGVVDELVRVSSVGIMLVVPLESKAKFDSYRGKDSPDGELGMHKFHTMDPLVWLQYFVGRDVVMLLSHLEPAHSDLTAIFVHPGVVTYGGRIYS